MTTDRLTARKQDTSQPARNLLSGLAPHPGPDLWAPHLGGSRNQQTRERPGVPAAQDEGCPHEPRDSGFQLWTGRLLLQKGTPASGPPAPTRPSPHSPASSRRGHQRTQRLPTARAPWPRHPHSGPAWSQASHFCSPDVTSPDRSSLTPHLAEPHQPGSLLLSSP